MAERLETAQALRTHGFNGGHCWIDVQMPPAAIAAHLLGQMKPKPQLPVCSAQASRP